MGAAIVVTAIGFALMFVAAIIILSSLIVGLYLYYEKRYSKRRI
jgi:hypothetical protein